jgi:hypothetical protein
LGGGIGFFHQDESISKINVYETIMHSLQINDSELNKKEINEIHSEHLGNKRKARQVFFRFWHNGSHLKLLLLSIKLILNIQF